MRKRKPGPARGRPSTGSALTPAERMRRLRARRKAAGLKAVVAWKSGEESAVYSSHRLLEIRSLAMHAVIARKIERDPGLLDVARRNLERWRARRQGSPPAWLEEWQALLERPWQAVAAFITGHSDRATRLRQSSPFAGILTNEERWRIHEAFRA
jgi:hypothetical protein